MADRNSPVIGPAVQRFRKQAGMTLDNLASASGVSRSMLSQIERGTTNPTLGTVWALSKALNQDISVLIGVRQADRRGRIDVASPTFTPEIRTEDGLCVLRILSPADRADSFEWYELAMAPGGALVSSPHAHGTREHLTVLEGELTVVSGEERSAIVTGATARYPADIFHEIINTSSSPARALLVVMSQF